jgi:hypothetical protein
VNNNLIATAISRDSVISSRGIVLPPPSYGDEPLAERELGAELLLIEEADQPADDNGPLSSAEPADSAAKPGRLEAPDGEDRPALDNAVILQAIDDALLCCTRRERTLFNNDWRHRAAATAVGERARRSGGEVDHAVGVFVIERNCELLEQAEARLLEAVGNDGAAYDRAMDEFGAFWCEARAEPEAEDEPAADGEESDPYRLLPEDDEEAVTYNDHRTIDRALDSLSQQNRIAYDDCATRDAAFEIMQKARAGGEITNDEERQRIANKAVEQVITDRKTACARRLAAEVGLTLATVNGEEAPESRERQKRVSAAARLLDGVTIGRGVNWTRPDGLLGQMADWILATSPYPNRPLAVAASVAVLSAVCGRRFYSPTKSALNVYIACLAGTAVGKDRPLKSIPAILHSAQLAHLSRSAKAFSVSGLEQLVAEAPACVATIDEFATNLLGRISRRGASSHETTMKSLLQELWSRAQEDAPFQTTRYAVPKMKDPRFDLAEPTTQIQSPSFTLFGVSTPQAFYEALTAGNIEDGFMNRFLIAAAEPRKINDSFEGADSKVPSIISERLQAITAPRAAEGNIAAIIGTGGHRLEWASPAAKAKSTALRTRCWQLSTPSRLVTNF